MDSKSSQNNTEQKVERLETESEDFELDLELCELRRRYLAAKKDRQRNEQDASTLGNRIKLLFLEEEKSNKAQEKHQRRQEEFEKIRNSIVREKNRIFEAKLQKERQMLEKKEQTKEKKEQLETSIRIVNDNLMKKKIEDLNKMKQLKQEYDQMMEVKKQEIAQKKQQIAKSIKNEKQVAEEKKRKDEIDKKLQQKKELENLIMQEEQKRMEIEAEINGYQLVEHRFIKRRNNSCATNSSKYHFTNPSGINVKRINQEKGQ